MALYPTLNTTDIFQVFNYTSNITCFNVDDPATCGYFSLFFTLGLFLMVFVSSNKGKAAYTTSLAFASSVSLVVSMFLSLAWNMMPQWIFMIFVLIFIGSTILLFWERRGSIY